MSEYYSRCRTNYFAVNDEQRFRDAINRCSSDKPIEIYESTIDGVRQFAFGCPGKISGIAPINDPAVTDGCCKPGGYDGDCSGCDGMEDCYNDHDNDLPAFYEALQNVVADGHAIIITEVGYEKMCCVVGEAVVITKHDQRSIDLETQSLSVARQMLGRRHYSPQLSY